MKKLIILLLISTSSFAVDQNNPPFPVKPYDHDYQNEKQMHEAFVNLKELRGDKARIEGKIQANLNMKSNARTLREKAFDFLVAGFLIDRKDFYPTYEGYTFRNFIERWRRMGPVCPPSWNVYKCSHRMYNSEENVESATCDLLDEYFNQGLSLCSIQSRSSHCSCSMDEQRSDHQACWRRLDKERLQCYQHYKDQIGILDKLLKEGLR